MNLTRVTITGADGSTDIKHLVELSKEFPFVEWGILVSKRQAGSCRFPSDMWMLNLREIANHNSLNLSMHMCGQWVRELLMGTLNWEELPSLIDKCQRIQINTHAEPHVSVSSFRDKLKEKSSGHTFIFQWDGINDHLIMQPKLCAR